MPTSKNNFKKSVLQGEKYIFLGRVVNGSLGVSRLLEFQ